MSAMENIENSVSVKIVRAKRQAASELIPLLRQQENLTDDSDLQKKAEDIIENRWNQAWATYRRILDLSATKEPEKGADLINSMFAVVRSNFQSGAESSRATLLGSGELVRQEAEDKESRLSISDETADTLTRLLAISEGYR